MACRLHTLAYVASSEKLYAFGSGENGQLGNNKVITVNSPVVVKNSWVSNDKKSHCSVQRIATGGDHCYAVTLKNVSNNTQPFHSQGVSLWWVKSSGIRQSKIYKGTLGLERVNKFCQWSQVFIFSCLLVRDDWNVEVTTVGKEFYAHVTMSEIHFYIV